MSVEWLCARGHGTAGARLFNPSADLVVIGDSLASIASALLHSRAEGVDRRTLLENLSNPQIVAAKNRLLQVTNGDVQPHMERFFLVGVLG